MLKRSSTFSAERKQLKRGAPLERISALGHGESRLKRSKFKRKARRYRADVHDPKYKAWIRTLPCIVCFREGVDPHHMIDGRGDARKGVGQTAPDRYLIPLCRRHHDQFHDRRGFCRNWTEEGRRIWQEEEIIRCRRVYAELLVAEDCAEQFDVMDAVR